MPADEVMRLPRTLTAYVTYDPDTRLYVGIVPGIPGAHSQGETLDELNENLREVLALCVEELGIDLDDVPAFAGLQQVEVPG